VPAGTRVTISDAGRLEGRIQRMTYGITAASFFLGGFSAMTGKSAGRDGMAPGKGHLVFWARTSATLLLNEDVLSRLRFLSVYIAAALQTISDRAK
jgi:hypothetical protein